jgi:hypothetical protein
VTLTGTPSDNDPAVLATGRSRASTLFVSMANRHPDGADADYLAWHTLDHRPEQHRLAELRGSLRLVSTPQCRSARAMSGSRLDAVDHVMTYFFTDASGLQGFADLGAALHEAGRTPYVLPPVERGVYNVGEIGADPAIKVGADVLPWWPATGFYLLVESAASPTRVLLKVPGVAGIWSAVATDSSYSSAGVGQQITYCFLDDDPVATAGRLRLVLEERWATSSATPVLAAPFHAVVPHDWQRFLP